MMVIVVVAPMGTFFQPILIPCLRFHLVTTISMACRIPMKIAIISFELELMVPVLVLDYDMPKTRIALINEQS